MIDNPAYKGEWAVKRISNPAYKGMWESKKIDNPEYEDDKSVYKYDAFGFIGFDLWQVKGGTIFDNIIVCDDKAEADAFAAKWKALSTHETAEKKKAEDAKKDEETKKEDDKDDDDDDEEDKKESEDM
jgi:calreticulin